MFPETPPIDKPVSLSQAATASRRTLATGLLLLQTAQGTSKSFPYVLRVARWLRRATFQSICGKTERQSGCSHRTAIGARACAHTLGAAVAQAVAPHSSGPSSCPGCESRPCPQSSLPIQGSGLGHPCTCWPRSWEWGARTTQEVLFHSPYLTSGKSCRGFRKAHGVGSCLPPRPRNSAGLCTFLG